MVLMVVKGGLEIMTGDLRQRYSFAGIHRAMSQSVLSLKGGRRYNSRLSSSYRSFGMILREK